MKVYWTVVWRASPNLCHLQAMDVDIKTILLRPKEFYDEYNIQILTSKEATGIDILKKKVTFRDGSSSIYNKLLLATGGRWAMINFRRWEKCPEATIIELLILLEDRMLQTSKEITWIIYVYCEPQKTPFSSMGQAKANML